MLVLAAISFAARRCYTRAVTKGDYPMPRKTLVLLLAAGLPVVALSQPETNYRCTQGGLVRRVEIVYETGVAVPCEVHYFKDTEAPGEREVLWNARNESGYCESRTREFVARLESLGWQCTAQAAREEGADDTAVLGAGDN